METPSAPIKEFRGHDDTVRSVTFYPDGKPVISEKNDKMVYCWVTKAWNVQSRHKKGGSELVLLAGVPSLQ